MLIFNELIEKHKAEYDKRYTSADGTTYCDPNRSPMTRGEFYSLMNDICERLFKEEDEENVRPMTSADDIKPKSAIYRTSFHGETWYMCPYCEKSFEFYDARNNKCPHCKSKIEF
jgi:hypothetical protein